MKQNLHNINRILTHSYAYSADHEALELLLTSPSEMPEYDFQSNTERNIFYNGTCKKSYKKIIKHFGLPTAASDLLICIHI